MYVTENSNLVIENSKLQNSSAIYGGGIFIDNAENIIFNNIEFANMKSLEDGSALYLNTYIKISIFNCTFENL